MNSTASIFYVIQYFDPTDTRSCAIKTHKDTDAVKAADFVWYLKEEGFIIYAVYREQNGVKLGPLSPYYKQLKKRKI